MTTTRLHDTSDPATGTVFEAIKRGESVPFVDAKSDTAANTQDKAIVTSIRASKASLDCPHCGAEQDGWMVDPRGREQTCDKCKQPYEVSPDASVQIS